MKKMAKFVKLEKGDYVNIDKIINIAPQQYEYLYGNKDCETSDDDFVAIISVGYSSPMNITITKTDVDNILKASEE